MKYLKKYEDQHKLPEIGDYVYLDYNSYNKILKDFLINRIGKVDNVTDHTNSVLKSYYIKFDQPNPWDYSKYMSVTIVNIDYWSSDKEDVERYIQMKNFNL